MAHLFGRAVSNGLLVYLGGLLLTTVLILPAWLMDSMVMPNHYYAAPVNFTHDTEILAINRGVENRLEVAKDHFEEYYQELGIDIKTPEGEAAYAQLPKWQQFSWLSQRHFDRATSWANASKQDGPECLLYPEQHNESLGIEMEVSHKHCHWRKTMVQKHAHRFGSVYHGLVVLHVVIGLPLTLMSVGLWGVELTSNLAHQPCCSKDTGTHTQQRWVQHQRRWEAAKRVYVVVWIAHITVALIIAYTRMLSQVSAPPAGNRPQQ